MDEFASECISRTNSFPSFYLVNSQWLRSSWGIQRNIILLLILIKFGQSITPAEFLALCQNRLPCDRSFSSYASSRSLGLVSKVTKFSHYFSPSSSCTLEQEKRKPSHGEERQRKSQMTFSLVSQKRKSTEEEAYELELNQ